MPQIVFSELWISAKTVVALNIVTPTLIIVAKEEERAGGLDMIYELMRMLGCEKTETVRDSYLSMLEKRGN